MASASDYLRQFKGHADEWFGSGKSVRRNYLFVRDFFRRENLEKLEWPDVQQLGTHLHCFGTMALARARALGKPNHPIEHYRASFLYLAHGPGEPAERVRRFDADPEYRLEYFGDAAVSELACYLFPEQFMLSNARVKFALQFLSIPLERPSGDDLVAKLASLSQATRPLAQLYQEIVGKRTDLPLNMELDQFFSWLYSTFSGDRTTERSPAKRHWLLSLGEEGRLWTELHDLGLAAIGWDELADLRQYHDKSQIRAKLHELHPETSQKNNALACWQFAHDIQPSDVIYAKRGRATLLGCGIVEGDYRHDASRAEYRNTRQVRWLSKGEWSMPEDKRFAAKTLTDITPFPEAVRLASELTGLPGAPEPKPGPEPAKSREIGEPSYWWLNFNPKIWNFEDTPIGHREIYTSHNDQGNKRQRYKYFGEVKPGDVAIGYVTNPVREIVGTCLITKGLHDVNGQEAIEFEKHEKFANPVSLDVLQAHPGLAMSEPIVNNQGSLFKLTPDEYEIIRDLIDELNVGPSRATPYTTQMALEGLFISPFRFDEILEAIREKKNIVLQGAPGVGKTFVAKRLAYALLGAKDDDRVQMIQFHQSYSYEEFVQGYRPTVQGGFELKPGLFYQFCRRAQRGEAEGLPYVFIIDEINRGNLSKIFGELLMLIESDKRGRDYAIPLTYSGAADEKFYVPTNLHFIGMMNTADRSLAMVDYALRRRFRFLTLNPEFESPTFRQTLLSSGAEASLVTSIVKRLTELNEAIAADTKNLGPGYQVGHSYFCPIPGIKPNWEWYRRVVESEIVPLLQEYWFDDDKRVFDLRDSLLQDLVPA